MNKRKLLCFTAVFMLVLMTFSACGGQEATEEKADANSEVTSTLSMSDDVKANW